MTKHTSPNRRYECKKLYTDLPAAHRQPFHDGHCRHIHGHNYSVELVFTCDRLEPETFFVVDYGKLKEIGTLLKDLFDHTMLVASNDPMLTMFQNLEKQDLMKVVVLPSTSAEGMASFIHESVSKVIGESIDLRARGVRVEKVTVWEDSRDSLTYSPYEC